jgi:ABC-type antimicrobial peptide transport system permease subunit
MILAALGIAVGAPVAFILSRFIGTLLYGLKPNDPLTVASATIALLFVEQITNIALMVQMSMGVTGQESN